jgi:negative regulator of replication initiation
MNERNIMHRSYTRTYMYHASRVKLFRDNLKRNRCILNEHEYAHHKRAIRAHIVAMRVTRRIAQRNEYNAHVLSCECVQS